MDSAPGEGGAHSRAGGANSLHQTPTAVSTVPVARIRPEDGLARKRDRDGHRELQRSISQFGVLTPITVRPAPDGTDDYLLIKGQGRTLACRLLGLDFIPAIVVDEDYGDDEKVQQFLVENVARLKMRPIDRALLIARARGEGEETASVASRFGVSAATVRRLEAQLHGASRTEVAALTSGSINLGLHAVIARHVSPPDRPGVISVIEELPISATDLDILLTALGWSRLTKLGASQAHQRIALLGWACSSLRSMQKGPIRERLGLLAKALPLEFGYEDGTPHLVAK